MNTAQAKHSFPSKRTMDVETFGRFSRYIEAELGIKMGSNKMVMLQARLMKRLRVLGLNSYEEYYDYLFSDEGHQSELPIFVHQVTTNKTDFFREPAHYEYLEKYALPALSSEFRYNTQRPLKLWSSACSTGEEPYTLAMVLSEFAQSNRLEDFSIIATDISPSVLNNAGQGVYDESRIGPVPLHLRKKYLMRSKDKKKKLVRIVPELRNRVSFHWINLKAPVYELKQRMDIIFCRNVIIYFKRSTQEKVLINLCEHLLPGGYLFMGHSETLSGFNLPLNQVATTVYRKI